MDPELNKKLLNIQSQKTHPIVFICGFGGSGKTTLAKRISDQNPNSKIIAWDWYQHDTSFKRRERLRDAFESGDKKIMDEVMDPMHWIDWQKLEKDLVSFQETGTYSIHNAWDQQTGEKDTSHSYDFEGKKGLIICEGMYFLHEEIKKLGDFCIFIDTPLIEARKQAEERDKYRSSPDHLARKLFIAENYDAPYFEKYRKNADWIITR